MATTRSSYLENFSTAYSLVVNCLSITNVKKYFNKQITYGKNWIRYRKFFIRMVYQ